MLVGCEESVLAYIASNMKISLPTGSSYSVWHGTLAQVFHRSSRLVLKLTAPNCKVVSLIMYRAVQPEFLH